MVKFGTIIYFFLILKASVNGEITETKKNWEKLTKKLTSSYLETEDAESIEAAIETKKNYHLAINLLLNFTDFQPLTIAVGYSLTERKLSDISRDYYPVPLGFDHYDFELSALSRNHLSLPLGLTWILIVDNIDTFFEKIVSIDIWKTDDNYLILIFDKRSERLNARTRELFEYFWSEHSVSNVLILSINDKFRSVYRYLPFERVGINDKFGKVQRLRIQENKICQDESPSDEIASGTNEALSQSPSVPRYSCWNENNNIFEDFININGYPINVVVFSSLMMEIDRTSGNKTKYKRLDANVMKLIEERLNSTFIIQVIEKNNNKTHDPFEAALKKLNNPNKSELIFTGFFIKFYTGNYDFTASVLEDKLCLVAPSSPLMPKYFLPLIPFSNKLWALLILYNLVIAIFWKVIQYFDRAVRGGDKKKISNSSRKMKAVYRGRTNNRQPDSLDPTSTHHPHEYFSLYETLKNIRARRSKSLQMRNDFPQLILLEKEKSTIRMRERTRTIVKNKGPPKINRHIVRLFDIGILACSALQGGRSNAEKALLVGTLFFSLIVIGLYNSCLVSSLSKPLYYPQLNTLSEVAESNYTIVTKYPNLAESLPNDVSPIIDKIKKKINVSHFDKRTYDVVAHENKIALARFYSFKLENLSEYHDLESNRLQLHMVEECAARYFLAYVARKGSPYLKRIDSLILRMHQAGLISRWYNDMHDTVKVAIVRSKLKRAEKRTRLSLAHFLLTFIGLGLGLFCSFLIFILEIYLAKKFR